MDTVPARGQVPLIHIFPHKHLLWVTPEQLHDAPSPVCCVSVSSACSVCFRSFLRCCSAKVSEGEMKLVSFDFAFQDHVQRGQGCIAERVKGRWVAHSDESSELVGNELETNPTN